MSYPTPIQHPQNWPQAGTVTDMAPKNRHWLGSDSGVPRGWKNVWQIKGMLELKSVKWTRVWHWPRETSDHFVFELYLSCFSQTFCKGSSSWQLVFQSRKWAARNLLWGDARKQSHGSNIENSILESRYRFSNTHVSMEDGSNPKALSWIVSFAYCGAVHLLPRLWEEVAMSKQTFHSETYREVPLHSKDAVSFNPTGPN